MTAVVSKWQSYYDNPASVKELERLKSFAEKHDDKEDKRRQAAVDLCQQRVSVYVGVCMCVCVCVCVHVCVCVCVCGAIMRTNAARLLLTCASRGCVCMCV